MGKFNTALIRILNDRDVHKQDFIKSVKVHENYNLSDVILGERQPTFQHILAIERVLDLPEEESERLALAAYSDVREAVSSEYC